jgi:peptidoglycan hydrolase CwlO-like protein
LKEKTLDLQCKVRALESNLLNRQNSLQKAQDKLDPLQQNLHSFQKKLQNKETKVGSTQDSSLCETIIDGA